MMTDFNREQKITILVFALANFCSAICVSLQAPFYPKEAEKKGATASQYGFVFGIYELFIFIASPILGRYMSKLGAKRVFNAGVFTTGTCSIIFGMLDFVPDGSAFISLSFIIRSVEAIGNACSVTASFSIIAKEFPDKVSTMFACLETCFGVGLIVGPSVGGAIYQFGGYIMPFVVVGTLLILTAILTCLILPSQYNTLSINEEEEKGWCAILRVPSIALATYSVICASLSLGFLQATLEPHLRQFNLSSVTLGGMFVIQGGTYAMTAPIWGWLCDKVMDPRIVTSIGSSCITLAFLLMGPVPFIPFATNLYVCMFTLLLHGVGFSAVLVSAFGMAHREAILHGFPDSLSTYALISALWISTFALGACVGPSVAGILVDHFQFGWASLFVVLTELSVLIVTIGFIGFKWWKRRNFAKGYETLTPQRENGTLSKGGYGAIPNSDSAATTPLQNRTIQIVPRTKRVFSPFVSPGSRCNMMTCLNADAIVVEENEVGLLAVPTSASTEKWANDIVSNDAATNGKKSNDVAVNGKKAKKHRRVEAVINEQ